MKIIRVGSVVRNKQNGQLMTVEAVDDSFIDCIYFYRNVLYRNTFTNKQLSPLLQP